MIASLDQYIAAAKQGIPLCKTAAVTAVGAQWTSVFAAAGNYGGGTLAGSSVAAGIVPDDTSPGYPSINAFGAGNTGYLSKVDFGNSVSCRIALYDRLFVAGAFPFNANQTLTGQPDFSSRLPGGDYGMVEMWLEQVTAGTGVQNVVVTYTDDADVSRSTGTVVAPGAMAVARCFQIPAVAGGKTIKKITNVTGSIATAGTFNVMLLRELWSGVVRFAGDGDTHGLMQTGMREVFEDSALYMLIAPTSTNTGIPDCKVQICNG